MPILLPRVFECLFDSICPFSNNLCTHLNRNKYVRLQVNGSRTNRPRRAQSGKRVFRKMDQGWWQVSNLYIPLFNIDKFIARLYYMIAC